MNTNLEYYLNLAYTKVVRRDEDGHYIAHVEELPGCVADGDTEELAIKAVDDVKRAWIEECLSARKPVPEPTPDEVLPSGKWVQRVPRSLHLKLSRLAKTEGVSLNHLVATMLAEAYAMRGAKRRELDEPGISIFGLSGVCGWEPEAFNQTEIVHQWPASKHGVIRVLKALTSRLPEHRRDRGRDRVEDEKYGYEADRKK
jgi:antitoxin HicB